MMGDPKHCVTDWRHRGARFCGYPLSRAPKYLRDIDPVALFDACEVALQRPLVEVLGPADNE